MGVPHETVVGGITGDGTSAVVGIPLPSRVKIHKVIVTRTDTPGSGSFTVDLFNRRSAALGTNKDAFASAIYDRDGAQAEVTGLALPENYRVMPAIAGSSGKAAYFADAGNGGYAFPIFNMDDADVTQLIGQNPRVLWVKITAVAGTYCVSIGTDCDVNM